MNIEQVRYFHINGLISGMFFSVLLLVLLFVVIFMLKQRKTSLFRTLLLSVLCFGCFWLFNIYFQVLPLPMESLYPAWIFHVSKVALPVGLVIFTGLFIQMSVLTSEASYWVYRRLLPALYLLVFLCCIAFVAFIFIPDNHLVIGLSELLLMYASLIGAVFSFKGIKPRTLGYVMGSTFCVGFVSFASIAYSVFFDGVGHSVLLLTIESLVIGLLALCLCLYILTYAYHELMSYSDADSYDWRSLLRNIHTAIEQEQFYLVYQPKVNVQDRTVIGIEALLRWEHPKYGSVSPQSFIPQSEKSYLINTICRWVIDQSVKQVSTFVSQGLQLTVSINFSVKNLNPRMVSFLEDTLKRYGVSPKHIVVEVTENIFIKQTDAEKKALSMLSELGVGLSLDDYGTGYSSLSTMNTLAIDELKIDKSFIQDIKNNAEHRIIVESILYMTTRLDVTVVAEGVENDDILALLGDLGCKVIQGYGVAKPMQIKALKVWLDETEYRVATVK